MATPTVTSADAIPFRVLYLFAGKARQADFGNALRSVVETWNDDASAVRISLHLEEIDTLRGGLAHDLLKEPARTDILRRIRAGEFDLVMVAPPCNTFSRAVFREGAGPKPVRSKQWPDGFPWLEGDARVRAEEGSVLTAFATQALAAAGEAKHEDPWRCTRRLRRCRRRRPRRRRRLACEGLSRPAAAAQRGKAQQLLDRLCQVPLRRAC